MKFKIVPAIALAVLVFTSLSFGEKQPAKWNSLFDGKTLNGWKVGTNATSFRVDSGMIIVNGNVGHLFYDGKLGDHNFKDFEFKAEVRTRPGSNSGIYFHTEYQQEGWPSKGYEVQVNNSQSDWRRTGSLYGILDVREKYVTDNEWYTEYIQVKGNRVIIKINDIVVVDYTEPANPLRPKGMENRLLSSGTFALQAHDPGSEVHYRNIMVKF